MQPPALITITGLPCSGKSFIGRRLATMLGLPIFDRDEFCDQIFEAFGHSHETNYRNKVGFIAGEAILMVARKELAVGRPIMLEAVLHPQIYNPLFLELYQETRFRLLQIVLEAEREALEQRYAARDASAEKMAGHWNLSDYPYRHLFEQGAVGPLDLAGEIIRVNTTDLNLVDFDGLAGRVQSFL